MFSRSTLSRSETAIAVLTFGLTGFFLPALYAYFGGMPVAHVHDEFGYLLAADTFANGRVTNPEPFAPESVEAPHILIAPSYMSKYPPMQGIFLAAGQVIFGLPAFGIWIACGFAAAALVWMLLAWVRPGWAFLGTGLMVVFLGIGHYWAQSFWGGMVAAGGGALFFGGFRRVFDNVSVSSSLLMTAGGVILVNSRPLEGAAMMIPPLLMLLVFLLKSRGRPLVEKLRKIVLPAAVLTVFALSAMAYYNYQITGHPSRFPYTEHQSEYFSTPVFIFLEPSTTALRGNPRLKSLYSYLRLSVPVRELDELGLPHPVWLLPFHAILYLSIFLPFSFLGPPLAILVFAVVPLLRKDRWVLLSVATISFTVCCMSLATYWDRIHYAAPLTPLFFFLAVEGIRYSYAAVAGGKGRLPITVLLSLVILSSALCTQISGVDVPRNEESDQEGSNLSLPELDGAEISISSRGTSVKHRIEKSIEASTDRYLAFVSYDENHDRHDDIVYNKADLENTQLLWLNDLGEENNLNVINHYGGRKVLLVHLGADTIKVRLASGNAKTTWSE